MKLDEAYITKIREAIRTALNSGVISFYRIGAQDFISELEEVFKLDNVPFKDRIKVLVVYRAAYEGTPLKLKALVKMPEEFYSLIDNIENGLPLPSEIQTEFAKQGVSFTAQDVREMKENLKQRLLRQYDAEINKYKELINLDIRRESSEFFLQTGTDYKKKVRDVDTDGATQTRLLLTMKFLLNKAGITTQHATAQNIAEFLEYVTKFQKANYSQNYNIPLKNVRKDNDIKDLEYVCEKLRLIGENLTPESLLKAME